MPPGWPATRALQLRLHPWCQSCGAKATTVHHVIPRYSGGTDQLTNLRSLCEPCHQRIPTWQRLS
jgi:5-methylcytosine-specific restriction protein A